MPDILICGMKMPKNCGSCYLNHGEYCFALCRKLKLPQDWDERPEACPLVELPAHGDLISRDEAVSVLQSIGSRDYRREKGTICDAIKMISHSQYVPTIVPASEEVTNDPKP